MAEFFNDDKPHSQAKRNLLQSIIATAFARNLNDLDVFTETDFVMRYVDAFAGQGWFGPEAPEGRFDYNDVNVWGTPIIAISVLIDHMENLFGRKKTQERIEFVLNRCLKTVEFFFNDASKDNIANLRVRIDQQMTSFGWRKTAESASAVDFEGPFFESTNSAITQSLRINFSAKTFEVMEDSYAELRQPMFSFLDPFGIKQIPMKSVERLVGEGKDILINLMVGTLNR